MARRQAIIWTSAGEAWRVPTERSSVNNTDFFVRYISMFWYDFVIWQLI